MTGSFIFKGDPHEKELLLGASVLAILSFFAVKNHKENQTSSFLLENILYNNETRCLSGDCIEGSYLGEMEVYLPETIDDSQLQDGQTVKVTGGPAMTMSLPPQLVQCIKIEIIK